MDVERKRANNWYKWLWLSPLLTIPTLVFIYGFVDPGYMLFCRRPGPCYEWELAQKVSLTVAVLLSSLWHLVLLKAVSDKSPFVHWHGLQALCLAGLRTAVPLLFVIVYADDYPTLYAIPILILIWLLGTTIGQQQASEGRCTLAKLAGQEDELARYQKPKRQKLKRTPELNLQNLKPLESGAGDAEELVNVIRFSRDSADRRHALAELKALDMVEDF